MKSGIKIHKFILIYTLLVFTFGCASPSKTRQLYRPGGIYHVVKKGETIWRIAKTYRVKEKVIKRVNHIGNVKNIKEGTKLFIPGAYRVLKVAPLKTRSKRASLRKKPSPYKKGFFIWPLNGTLTSSYGIRNKHKHDGIDIAAPKGTPIKAAASGRVVFSDWGPTGYGRMVIIKHNEKWATVYAHTSKNLVKKNQAVRKGQKIAYVGSTGRSTGPHLHFEVREKRKPVNPISYLNLN